MTASGTEPESLSFIIPAFNEEKHIGDAIRSIQSNEATRRLVSEIIVVDNGSKDATAAVARQLGAQVVTQIGGTIGSLRNLGVRNARGSILVFIDADITLEPAWHANITAVIERMRAARKLVTGSHCRAPRSNNPLWKYWFDGLALEGKSAHLGTAHLIVTRQFFEELHGFDAAHATGEDYFFCEAVSENGGRVENNLALEVIHHGFPRTVAAFVRRERWHGVQDWESLKSILASKVALGSLVFIACNLGLVIGAIYSPRLAVVCAIALIIELLASSALKFRHLPLRTVLINGAIFYLYYFGRALSPLGRSTRSAR